MKCTDDSGFAAAVAAAKSADTVILALGAFSNSRTAASHVPKS
jgi:hypothetical protein